MNTDQAVQFGQFDIFVFAAYMVLVLLVGLVAARRAGATKRDYFLAGDKLPWWTRCPNTSTAATGDRRG